ncbi:MAG: hypothetical protein ACTSWY_14360 [Promethearchaeota archaeon]
MTESKTTEMIVAETVGNNIVNALLHAIQDVMGFDGKLSIIRFAGVEHLKEQLPSHGDLSIEEFQKLVDSLNYLLLYSKQCMYEIGRKFSFYLSPYGLPIYDFIALLKKSMKSTKIEMKITSKEINIKIYDCPFCLTMKSFLSKDKEFFTCEFFKGVFFESVTKNANQNTQVEIKHLIPKNFSKNSNVCKFQINFK